ncbi:MAG: SDR family oxidoreductase [Actinobacteria bacterium]|nr:MAG: SDR family oxidoreductase [Actinomycetota bacterium]
MRALVTGGAGFLGSHLCERLVAEGHDVLCYDSLMTGSRNNLAALAGNPGFEFRQYDVTRHLDVDGAVDWVLHFASPASPRDYLEHPIHTLKVGALGTLNCLGLAKARGAGLLLASTSEVYGDPLAHPQQESYWGNVNPVGPRGVYDEAKRFAEALTMAYHDTHGVEVRIARIFNTFGPRMRKADGRAVPTFIHQALTDQPITVHGDGSQTRSLAYVDDTVEGFIRLLEADGVTGPVNIGNPEEVTVRHLAERIRDLTGAASEIHMVGRPVDDPERRCPDISLARQLLGWAPAVTLDDGLQRTIDWCRRSGWAGEDLNPANSLLPSPRMAR